MHRLQKHHLSKNSVHGVVVRVIKTGLEISIGRLKEIFVKIRPSFSLFGLKLGRIWPKVSLTLR